jgi:predicted nucleic acid-binding protein
MIVVADTSPLNYLALIGEIELLAALYQTVLIPEEVHQELLRDQAPPAVRMWAASLPAWCKVRSVNPSADPVLSELDPGERDAILLALEAGIDTELMDEIAGRQEAARRHLNEIGQGFGLGM